MRQLIRHGFLVLVSGLFLYAGISKLLDPVEFARSIQHYRIIGHPYTLLAALWVPWLESVAGVAILLRRWRLPGFVLLLGLLMAFEVILASAYLRGLDIDCGCFGSGYEQGILFAFVRNLALMAIILYILSVNWKANEAS